MSTELQDVIDRLQIDTGNPQNECLFVQNLIQSGSPQLEIILRWLFKEHRGYVETRAFAGIAYLQKWPSDGWDILEELFTSHDPDEREIALTIAKRIDVAKAKEQIKKLLADPYPYLQLLAAESLMDILPDLIRPHLDRLASSDEEWVASQARDLQEKL